MVLKNIFSSPRRKRKEKSYTTSSSSTVETETENTSLFNSSRSDTTLTANVPTKTIISENERLIQEAEAAFAEDRILEAMRLLQSLDDGNNGETLSLYRTKKPHLDEMLRLGGAIQAARDEMLGRPDQVGWKKQGEAHDEDHVFDIYYKISDSGICSIRIDTPIKSSLMVPFFAVFNEPELQKTWIPSWTVPFKIGVSKTCKLAQLGRVRQVVQMQNDFGFLNKRETILQIVGDDDSQHSRIVTMKLKGLMEPDGQVVPEFDKRVVRMDLDGGLLFQPCPDDHVLLQKCKQQRHHQQLPKNKTLSQDASDDDHHHKKESMFLLTYTMTVDPKVTILPKAFLNFCTRTVVGQIWRKMIHVAEQVRDGQRMEFIDVMRAKRSTIYDWMHERAEIVAGGDGTTVPNFFDHLPPMTTIRATTESTSQTANSNDNKTTIGGDDDDGAGDGGDSPKKAASISAKSVRSLATGTMPPCFFTTADEEEEELLNLITNLDMTVSQRGCVTSPPV